MFTLIGGGGGKFTIDISECTHIVNHESSILGRGGFTVNISGYESILSPESLIMGGGGGDSQFTFQSVRSMSINPE